MQLQNSLPLTKAWDEVLRRMEIVSTPSKTISEYQRIIRKLKCFMDGHDIDMYSPDVGQQFLDQVVSDGKQSSGSLWLYRSSITRLNSTLSDTFWGEEYDLRNYVIKTVDLQKMSEKLLQDLHYWESKASTKAYSLRGIRRLDIFMRENGEENYTPEIGGRFLKCMEINSGLSPFWFSITYQKTILRLNAYYCGIRPVFKRTRNYNLQNSELREYFDILWARFKENQFADTSIPWIVISQLDFYLKDKGIDHYTPEAGKAFIEEYRQNYDCSSHDFFAVPVIAHLNDVFAGKPFCRYHIKDKELMPEGFVLSFEAYFRECERNGNALKTLMAKQKACEKFFLSLIHLGISDIHNLTPDSVVELCANLPSHYWDNIRSYLRYCSQHEFTSRDYSWLVPHKKLQYVIPPYYTKEERQRLEAAPDRNTAIGKRDYAIILIANRLGIRSGDIVELSFTEFNHNKRSIDFEQFKTKKDHSLPLLAEIEEAVNDYVANGRPASDSKKIFLMSYAPFYPLGSSAIYGIITKYFILADVNISNRKHGAHALRASLSTDLINNGFSYEQTSDIMGHKDKNTITHYANLDVQNLRLCAHKAYPPTGFFLKLLEEGWKERGNG